MIVAFQIFNNTLKAPVPSQSTGIFFEPFPAIRSKLLASLKGFPLLSGVI
jgi:hypothetical protein